jgi:hypothetical protein
MSDDQNLKLIRMLTSDNPGEVFNAAQMLKRRAAAAGKSLPEFMGGPSVAANFQRWQRLDANHQKLMERQKERTRRFERTAHVLGTFVSPRVRDIAALQVEKTMDLSDDEFMRHIGRPSWAKASKRETA